MCSLIAFFLVLFVLTVGGVIAILLGLEGAILIFIALVGYITYRLVNKRKFFNDCFGKGDSDDPSDWEKKADGWGGLGM